MDLSYEPEYYEVEEMIDDQDKSTKNDDQLIESTSKLFNKQISDDLTVPYDIKFLVNNQKFFEAHKFLLGLRSPVFNRMFWPSSDLTIEPTDFINIPDIEPEAFQNLLKYIYTDEVVKNFEDFSSTFKAADKYLLSGLCKKLLDYIDKVLIVDNAAIIFDQFMKLGQLQDDKRINMNDLLYTINLHAYLVFNSEWFLKISKETLIELLENQSLLIDEIDLFSCCSRWIKYNSKNNANKDQIQQELFNSFKHLIRFPLMSKEEFFGTQRQVKNESFKAFEIERLAPAKSGLFTSKELEEFNQYFQAKNSELLSTNYPLNKRDQLQVARLDYDWKNHEYKMMKIDDDELVNNDGNIVYKDTDGSFTDDKLQQLKNGVKFDSLSYPTGDEYPHPQDPRAAMLTSTLNSAKKSKKETKLNKDIDDAIYVFKIQQIAGKEEFNQNLEFDIFANSYHSSQSNRPRYYRNYCKNGASFNCIFPMIKLTKGESYQIQSYHRNYNRFGYTRFGSISFQIKNILNNENQIDVQTQILSGRNPCAFSIYFLYKKHSDDQ